jgi:serine/threonine protein kinase
MAPPRVLDLEELTLISELTDANTGDKGNTVFAVSNDQGLYFGQLAIPKNEISVQQVNSALTVVPDEDVFPPWPWSNKRLVAAPDILPADTCVRIPDVFVMYYKFGDGKQILRDALLVEAEVLQILSEHSHPNILGYHGCLVRRGRITGLVVDKCHDTLRGYVENGTGKIDQAAFMKALESAVQHMHSLGLAHNDLNPGSVMVNEAGMPVVTDFGTANKIGQALGSSRGSKGWIEGDTKDYTKSEKDHDIFALRKIGEWLDTLPRTQ